MLNKKQHILYISGWYPNRTNPTLGNFIQKHAEAANLFCDISVVHACADENLKSANYEIVVESINNILTILVYYKKITSKTLVISSIQKLNRYIGAYALGFKKLVEEKGKPHLVHLNILIRAGLVAIYLKYKHGLNYVYTEHWTGFLPGNLQFKSYTLSGMLYKYIANRSKALMPVTKNLQNALIKNGIKGNYHIISNVVDTAVFRPATELHENKKFKFIHISHAIDDHKNVSGILRAAEKFKNIRSDFELKIISDGNLVPHIAYAKELELYNTNVFFENTRSTQEIADCLVESDCLVLFSNYENFPCVIPEAMACGLPIISSNVGGIAEHLSKEMGELVSPRNENEFVMAMKKMMEQHINYNPQKLRAYAVKHFSYDTVGSEISLVYKSALKNA